MFEALGPRRGWRAPGINLIFQEIMYHNTIGISQPV